MTFRSGSARCRRLSAVSSAVSLAALLLAMTAQEGWVAQAAETLGGVPAATRAVGDNRVAMIRRVLLDAKEPGVLVVSHRGFVASAPENSLASIRAAAEVGAHVAEIDVARTADGVYVLLHDKTLNRTTTGKGKLGETTLAELRKLQLVSNALRPSVETIPTLDEAFEAARGQVMLNLDPKDLSIPEAAALARKAGMIDHCIFKLDWKKTDAELKAWLKANLDVFFMPICAGMAEVKAAQAERVWPAIEVVFTDAADPINDPVEIAKLRALGTRLWFNVLADGRWSAGVSDRQGVRDPASVYGGILDRGFSILQTDLADVLVPVIRERGLLPR